MAGLAVQPVRAALNAIFAAWTGGMVILAMVMAAAWLVQRRTRQGAWVDTLWSAGLAAAGCWGALVPADGSLAPSARQLLVAALVTAWGLRLSSHLAIRAATGPKDARYAQLEADWGKAAAARMFGFLMLQAAAGGVLLVCLVAAARKPAPGLSLQDMAGAALLLLAVAGEGLADRQLRAFKQDPANAHGVCDRGLWGWSRHPNYVCEWLGWCAWPVIAVDLGGGWPWGWLALAGPAYMYWLLTRVSGVPLVEAHMRRTRPAAFEAYARRVPVFLPVGPMTRRRTRSGGKSDGARQARREGDRGGGR